MPECEFECEYKYNSDAQVMELAQGGSLLDYVRQRKRLAESEACFFLQQIVHGLMHCHDMEVSIQLCPDMCAAVASTVTLNLVLTSPPRSCWSLKGGLSPVQKAGQRHGRVR